MKSDNFSSSSRGALCPRPSSSGAAVADAGAAAVADEFSKGAEEAEADMVTARGARSHSSERERAGAAAEDRAGAVVEEGEPGAVVEERDPGLDMESKVK